MEKKDTPQLPPKRKKGGKPPFVLIIWIIVLCTIGMIFINRSSLSEPTTTLAQSDFFKLLEQDKVKSITLTPTSNSSIWDASGVIIEPGTKLEMRFKSQIMNSPSLLDKLIKYKEKHPEFKSKVDENDNILLSLLTNLLPLFLIIFLLYFLFGRNLKGGGKGPLQFGKSKARMISPENLNITFDDIAGADEAKEETKEIIDFLKDPEKFKEIGGKIPKGCLLMGPPGTGKTLLAKAVASEASVPFFAISGSDFVEMFVGVGASRVRDLFEEARKHSPSIIFIDEIDAVGRSRFSGMGGGHDEREQTLNAMLVEMDGLETQGGVIVMAATNRPDVLDPALLRPGRFDRQISLDLPDIKGRRQIIDVHIKNIKVGDNVDLDLIARGTPGFSGADIANLINEAALHAARKDRKFVKAQDFEEARDKVNWGRERKSKKMPEKERIMTSYHEVGHALVTLYSEKATPLHKVTIIPRGRALGMTMSLPVEDSYSTTKSEYLTEIAILMGGYVAEEIKFGDVTSGASSDIDRATNIAQAMVCKFGMSDKIGVIKYSTEQRDEFHPGGRGSYSPETAREIDMEVKRIITECKQQAYDLINKYMDEFEKFAQELLEKETMDVIEIKNLLNIPLAEADMRTFALTSNDEDSEEENSKDSDEKAEEENSKDSDEKADEKNSKDSDEENSKDSEEGNKDSMIKEAETSSDNIEVTDKGSTTSNESSLESESQK